VASKRWLSIKVELLSGPGLVVEHPARRVMIASARHKLAEAIDLALARWEHSHLHLFEFGADGATRSVAGSSGRRWSTARA
jgi:hypothetical protein